jgi:non-homologous end joining protein Ku
MNKEERMRQALDEMFKPDEKQSDRISDLFDKMTGHLTTQERVDRFKTLLKELRNESREIQRILMEEGQPSGINVLSITEHLDEAIRFADYVCGVPDHLRK